MKNKLTVTTDAGTVSRNTDRDYAFVVVVMTADGRILGGERPREVMNFNRPTWSGSRHAALAAAAQKEKVVASWARADASGGWAEGWLARVKREGGGEVRVYALDGTRVR